MTRPTDPHPDLEPELHTFLQRIRPLHDGPADRELAAALSARIREQVGREEGARREAAGRRRRLLWGRILAVSVAAHVVVLGFLALRLHQEQADQGRSRITVRLPELPLQARDLAELPDLPASPWLPTLGELDLPALPHETENVAGSSAGPSGALPLLDRRHDHPRLVLGPMLRRTQEELKRSRLRRLGMDDDRTLDAVSRGLRGLARRQKQDGSFPAAAGTTPLGATSVALLPFLGDGHGSKRGIYGPRVVQPGIAWLRSRLAAEGAEASLPTPALGMALKALAEDYMLSYGNLMPGEARARADEIEALAGVVAKRQQEDGAFQDAGANVRLAIWPMWGLDAAARSGAVVPPAEVAERFTRWFDRTAGETRADDAAGLLLARHLGAQFVDRTRGRAARVASDGWDETGDPFLVAATGSGLLRADPQAFRRWSRGLDESLAMRLPATGIVQKGDPIADTAMVLLALQAAYRTY